MRNAPLLAINHYSSHIWVPARPAWDVVNVIPGLDSEANINASANTDIIATHMGNKIYVWDLPVRVFHWLLVGLVAFQFASGNIGGNLLAYHVLSGYAILSLLVFRIIWGAVGSSHARFGDFIHGPQAIAAYWRGEFSYLGHNPLGGLNVLAMILILLGIAGLGLFSNDDIMTEGPLIGYISKHLSDSLTTYHKWGAKLLLGLVALHVGAIVYYAKVKRESLVLPMITGYKSISGKGGEGPARVVSSWLALMIFLFAAGLVAVLVLTAPQLSMTEY